MKAKERRYLRPLKLGKRSQDFFVFDVETGVQNKNGDIQYMLSARPEHFIFAVVYGRNFCRVFYSPDELKKEFKKKRYRNKTVYAHNAEYDLSATFGNIYDLDREAIFNGKFISATNGVCTFADSFNILPTSVKKLGELLKLPKLELGKNLVSNAWKIKDDIAYCVRDCEIVYKSLQKVFNGLEPSFTIGSLSLKLFRSQYLKRTVKVNPLSDEFFNALYGGRTEAFKIGKCRAKVYDINSAYPYVMREKAFVNPSTLRVAPKIFDLYELFEKYEGYVKATVKVDRSEKLPVLPYRWENKLIFPAGEFSGAWTFPEIRYALENTKTEIINIDRCVIGERIESPFRNFVNDLWEKRYNTNDEFERYYYKLYMNNLYGKTIQRAKEEYRFCENEAEAWQVMREKKLRRCEIIEVQGGYFLRYDNDRIFSHTVACWGSYVTAYVRIMLHELMSKHFSKVVYCDTDSVFIEKELPLNSKELGGWKLENKIITKVRALKDYVYIDDEGEEKQMLKGVKRGAVQLDPESNAFVYQKMIRTRESLRRKDLLPPGTFIKQLKLLTGEYSKREILPNGKTKPFIL